MEKVIKHLDVLDICKKNGVKMTQQREIIADVITFVSGTIINSS